ncbi:phosphoglycerate dehydrogenase (plasmid) [Lichenicola cladoniae]|uniref:D-3-phosphoglycerate dehydrogenase n=1 Tax=Lichenicola cladoniae TaxID=1484109 RepID=A0A6M8HXJ9_9PROT|nr:phosphoglycerate dehydrogenase [Lichenicola cladoniae]NPD68687.1 phosphoglycerate dehydrogenase [Acetobacteraceae bacterium]QKE93068.1 phosphoglycerate dehydrogenase [Lichenicola cladoniae]
MQSDAQLSLSKDTIRVLLVEGVHQSAVELFERQGYHAVEQRKSALDGAELRAALRGVHLLGIRSRTQITAEVLKSADKLIAVGCFCIGTNQVALDAATRCGIPVFNAPYSNTRSVAELVMGEIVMLMRGIFPRSVAAHAGGWQKLAANSWEVRGKTLGIVGYGSIGSQLSVLAEAFGMQVLYYDVAPKLGHGKASEMPSLTSLLENSDVVSLHVPQTVETRGMIGNSEISAMKPGAFLINNARGDIVDLQALAAAVKDGRLSGAAIDVFPHEPSSNLDPFVTPLQGCDNVILTPHIGASTIEAQERIGVEVACKLIDYSDVGTTLGALNFPQLRLRTSSRGTRFMHVHTNAPGILRKINDVIAASGANITAQFLQTYGEIGYVVIEAETDQEEDIMLLRRIRALPGTIRARLLYAACS